MDFNVEPSGQKESSPKNGEGAGSAAPLPETNNTPKDDSTPSSAISVSNSDGGQKGPEVPTQSAPPPTGMQSSVGTPLASNDKWKEPVVIVAIVGVIVTLMVGIPIAIIAILDYLNRPKPFPNSAPNPHLQAEFTIINQNSVTTPDSIILIGLKNNAPFIDTPVNIMFDTKEFEKAAQKVKGSPTPRWEFKLSKHTSDPVLVRAGGHKIKMRYPGQEWSEAFTINFLDSLPPIPNPDSSKKNLPQFTISNPHRHPDSTITIWPSNTSAQRLNSPLWAKFDNIEIETPLVQELDRNGRMLWKFNLRDANSKLKPELQNNGIHALQLKFRDSEWSKPYYVRFDTLSRRQERTLPIPPPQLVDVNIESGSNDSKLRLRYGIQAGHILSYINGRTAAEILRERLLKDDITREGWLTLEELLQDNRISVVTQNSGKPILAVVTEWEGGYEVRPILVHLTAQTNGKPLRLILVFDKEKPPNLVNVEYDQLACWFHLTQYQNPLATEDSEYDSLRNFFDHVEGCYNSRNLDCLEAAFVDTAKILVGTETSGGVRYQIRTKKAYFRKLEEIFKVSTDFKVHFSLFVFKRMPDLRGCYFVEMRQNYKNDGYVDEGTVSMLVEIDARNNTVIIKRSWQPLDRSSDLFRTSN